MEINENTSEFPTIKSGRNKNSNKELLALNLEKNSNSKENSMKKLENKDNNESKKEEKEESFKIIKEEKKYNNVTKIEIKDLKKNKENNINNNSSKNYNFIYSNTSLDIYQEAINNEISKKTNRGRKENVSLPKNIPKCDICLKYSTISKEELSSCSVCQCLFHKSCYTQYEKIN